MKKILILAIMSTFAMSGFTNEAEIKMAAASTEDARLCKVFTDKVAAYEATIRDDSLAEATLVSYKQRMNAYCDASSVKS